MNASIFSQPIANLYRGNETMNRNLAYIQKELPSLAIPADLREEISTRCNTFQWTLSDLRKEIRTLEDKLGMHPGEEPFDPGVNPDPRVTMGLIERWTAEELSGLRGLVEKLDRLAEQDPPAYDLVRLLVKESAIHIFKAFFGIREDLKFIGERLEPGREG